MKRLSFLIISLLVFSSCVENSGAPGSDEDTPQWVSLFDGESLDGWIPKIRGHELGENFANTFRVRDGQIEVGYDEYEGAFAERFGHLFHESSFSSYRFRMEYKFFGEQAEEGPGWAWRNSGIMVHCQDPATMTLEQDFPRSVEVQLLGGPEEGDRPTANLCTPGTHVVMGDSVEMRHCLNSSSETYRGDQWVSVMVEVYADSLIRHIVEGDTVMIYYQPQVGGENVNTPPSSPAPGTLISEGWISLQSESHPVAFRKIEIMEL